MHNVLPVRMSLTILFKIVKNWEQPTWLTKRGSLKKYVAFDGLDMMEYAAAILSHALEDHLIKYENVLSC